jgi:diguanylate cyclase (GGDEF)-like protein
MSSISEPIAPQTEAPAPAASADRIDDRLGELNSLLEHWQQVGAKKQANLSATDQAFENCLVQVRLGMASSLFMALRCKHAPTASHSLRVALGCSAWATALDMSKEEREAIEVAALLHDVGKIGVPDRVLLKPGALATEEVVLMDRYRKMTIEILISCCASQLVLSLVTHAPAWYDGSRAGSSLSGEKLPLGSRLIAIMDAFDAMTCAQIYRPAISHERAVKELFAFAGTQFDPKLVQGFSELHERDLDHLHRRMAAKWLQDLDAASTETCWQLSNSYPARTPLVTEALFQQKLLDNMYDAVVFLDNNLQVTLWNRGAERLTGLDGAAVFQRPFKPSLFELRDERGEPFRDANCPVAHALHTGTQSLQRMVIRGRNDHDVAIDAHILPVAAADGTINGVTLMLHDISPEASLEERCQRLHEKAIRDPLTQVANRAEFDRVHSIFVETHLQRDLSCSLMICDIDHFKSVNDNFGHPAGDEVIKSFAQLLKSSCRSGDLVARYGGEEFVMLCADCNVATAFERTEQIRRGFAELPQLVLGGRAVTASFGVTETQAGDTAETMLNRADRALLLAKESGRNMVVQLGAGGGSDAKPERRHWWQFWQAVVVEAVLEQNLIATVPLKVAIEKLRGFVADHDAEIKSIEDNRIQMHIQGDKKEQRRCSDRGVPLVVELAFAEEQVRGNSSGNSNNANGPTSTRTRIQVVIRPKRTRDRRRAQAVAHARQLLSALRSYLMATDDHSQTDDSVFRRSSHMLMPWLLKK